MYTKIGLFIIVISVKTTLAQSVLEASLPEVIDTIEQELLVNHFPNPVNATTDPEGDFKYYWKHTTSVLSPKSSIKVTQCGAYIYYNDQWNLRVEYDGKTFAKRFHCKNANMNAGQPYTFPQNWRTDNRLLGGWALWYVIGKTASGKTVGGYGIIETAGQIY